MERRKTSTQILKNEWLWQQIQLAALYAIPWALFFSEALSSILVIIFSLPLFFFGSKLREENLLRRMWPFFTVIGLIMISGFWSYNTIKWLELIRINLPYLVMPAAFCLWPETIRKQKYRIAHQFFYAGIVLSIYIIFLFLREGDRWGAEIASGGFLPVPVHHVRTGLFMAIGLLTGWHALTEKTDKPRQILWISMILLIAGLHLLAVRSGLILGYAGTIIYFMFHPYYRGKKGILAILLMGLVLTIAFLWSPTLSGKWNYWKEDRQNKESNAWWFYSDAMRWKTNKTGWQIAIENRMQGVGMGDLQDEMTLRFLEQENIYTDHYPHNLWITILAGTGILGWGIFNFSLAVLFFRQWNREPLFGVIFLIFLGSCLVENTLLSSLGAIGFCTLFILTTPGTSSKILHPETGSFMSVGQTNDDTENKSPDMSPPGHPL